ncbi:MAG: UDP-N-acetylmuramate:L-alanyl-gamma-D-glutamyl-meso-diaminopimelate ligase [Gammaproteobacteria bacterium RIFCSPHIGHO2_12_FULL_38_11]|nr:MAG: UDP-N-acetylmuramate:L-alanyl-gamma-D-glutamyl-meso-diaminopimelate ligase [Gammaproteobacteria bacterium RIFCSPHIGHO2_12_FULL_38_11]
MRIHIVGICGTFMGGVALIARELGHTVTGSDLNIYPPMSDALINAGIDIRLGYEPSTIDKDVDLVIIGNTISRSNPSVDYVLNNNINYNSGAQWMGENVLRHQHVLAVSGTHGKTTTTAILTWILETAGLHPGYLIGGVPKNFEGSSRLGAGKYFVIEADEYDTVFYDKRSKFLHYRPNTLIINNIEYDHADIFPDLEAIKKQFQILLRTVPSNGSVIYPESDINIPDVLSRGCWGKKIITGGNDAWHAKLIKQDGSEFECYFGSEKRGHIKWSLVGNHNIQNALAAIVAADAIGISKENIVKAFATFENVKRRLEIRGCVNEITIYDDFAHHPTAIATTIDGLRKRVGNERIIAIAQLGSNSMKMGAHGDALGFSFEAADEIHILRPEDKSWDIEAVLKPVKNKAFVHDSVSDIVESVSKRTHKKDHVLVMSNKGFDGIHEKLLAGLTKT